MSKFHLRSFKGRMTRRYRQVRLAFLRFLVVMYALPARFLNWCSVKSKEAQEKIENAKKRPFFVVDNPNKTPMPSDHDLRYETTRLALKQLGTIDSLNPFEVKEPTRRMVFDAMKRAEMVRGDGVAPTPPAAWLEARKPKIDPAIEELVQQSELRSKALVDGLIGGLAVAALKANAGVRNNDLTPEDDDVDLDPVRKDTRADS